MRYDDHKLHPSAAAEVLGVSVDCVYERIRRGELLAERNGNRWMVVLDRSPSRFEYDERSDADPAQPLKAETRQSVASDTGYEASALSLAHQVAAQSELINQIQARLDELQQQVQIMDRPVPSATVPGRAGKNHIAASRSAVNRSLRRRYGLLAFVAIASLVLGGIAIQSSAAQRSDDLMVAFVFVCGTVTGAIAAWLALDDRRADDGDTHSRNDDRTDVSTESEAARSVSFISSGSDKD